MWQNFFKPFRNEKRESSLVSYKTAQISGNNSYDELAIRGYQKNIIVYRCVHLIAKSIASVNLVIQKINDNREVVELLYHHEILNLIETPNPQQHQASFIEAAISYLLISGNCYIMVIKDENGIPKELHLLRPDRVKIIPGDNSMPLGYEYHVKNSTKIFSVNQETGESDILHTKLFHPTDDWYGMSPIESAMLSINQHNAISAQNTAFLHNGGRPSGALIYKSVLDSHQRESLRADLKNLYEGGRNAGKILLLEGDFAWQEMGLSPKDLDFIAGKELSAKEIAATFGVPGILIGSMDASTFANYKEARNNFWEETVLPIMNLFVGEMSNWITKKFDVEHKLWYDIDSIQSLSKRRESEWTKINAASFLTNNEKRAEFGYAPVEDNSIIAADEN